MCTCNVQNRCNIPHQLFEIEKVWVEIKNSNYWRGFFKAQITHNHWCMFLGHNRIHIRQKWSKKPVPWQTGRWLLRWWPPAREQKCVFYRCSFFVLSKIMVGWARCCRRSLWWRPFLPEFLWAFCNPCVLKWQARQMSCCPAFQCSLTPEGRGNFIRS